MNKKIKLKKYMTTNLIPQRKLEGILQAKEKDKHMQEVTEKKQTTPG